MPGTPSRLPASVAAAFLVSAATFWSVAGQPEGSTAVAEAPASSGSGHVDPTEDLAAATVLYRQHITTLSNPFFEGRAPGSRGNRLAADYIEHWYKQAGLLPAFPAGGDSEGVADAEAPKSYRQPFTLAPAVRPDTTKITAQDAAWMPASGGDRIVLEPGTDFNVLGYSGTAAVDVPLAFAGYSINAASKEFITYADDTDLAGKAVIVMRFEPMDDEGKSRWSGGDGWSFAAGLAPKIRQAAQHGAAAVILVNPPGADDPRIAKLEGLALASGASLDIPVVMLSQNAADRLVRAADSEGRSLLDLRKVADEKAGIIDLPGARLALDIALERLTLEGDNVGAILPGRGDLADEFIVVGSHYDHVGYGYFGSTTNSVGEVHPGADDNASGTSGTLLLAKRMSDAYAALPDDAPARSVLFICFSGEESGLEGSRHHVSHLVADADKHSLMINMDMIGRLRDRPPLEIGGVGTAPGLRDWMTPYVEAFPHAARMSDSGFAPSDNTSFTLTKIPALFFFTGTHPEYHNPKDTIDTINIDGAVAVADLAYRVALDAALRPQRFEFETGAEEEPSSGRGSATGMKVRFGIMPGDYSGTEPGVLIGDVLPGLPAEKAGLKEGDLITKWNGEAVDGVESWMPMLGKHEPGDKVTITYLRDKQEATVEVTLVARGGRQ